MLRGLITSLGMVLLSKVTPFEMVYGQEVVLLVKVNLDANRLARQNDLPIVMYQDMMR